MSACVPVRDMKDTATFTALVESERDVTVTKNGYEAMHCISSDQYRLMQEEIAKAKLLSRMMLAEDEISQGDYSDYDAVAIECQDYPDAPNHPSFPSTLLRPGERYHRTIIFRFTTK